MSSASPDFTSRTTNPLFMPMVIVSSLAVVEAVALVILLAMLARQSPTPAPPVVSTPGMASAAGTSAAERGSTEPSPPGAATVPAARTTPPAAELPHGKRGERVESAGFAVTVENILYQPPSGSFTQIGPEQRYLALLLLVENNTGGSVSFYPVMFRLQDSQSYEYEPLALKLIAPSLEWRHMGNRETVRGYVDFIVPKSSKGLTLIYTHLAQPIHIDLGE